MSHQLLKRLAAIEEKFNPRTTQFQVYATSKRTREKVLIYEYPVPRSRNEDAIRFIIGPGIMPEEEIEKAKIKVRQ